MVEKTETVIEDAPVQHGAVMVECPDCKSNAWHVCMVDYGAKMVSHYRCVGCGNEVPVTHH